MAETDSKPQKGQRRGTGASVTIRVRIDREMHDRILAAVEADPEIEDKSAYARWALGVALLARDHGVLPDGVA